MTRFTIARLLVSLVAVVLLLAFVPVWPVLDAIGRIGIGVVAVSLALFLAGHALNAVKLRMLLGWEAVPMAACLRAQYLGIAAGLGLPGLAGGDVVRGVYLAPAAGARRVVVASVTDRVVDTLTLVILVALALPLAGVPAALRGVVPGEAWWAIGGMVGAAGLLGAAILLRRHDVVRGSAVAGALIISLVVQTGFVLINVWMAREVGVQTGTAAWFVAWPLSKLVAVLPISLGGLGVREAALVSLMVPYGAPRESVLAAGILWQAVIIVAALVGLTISTTRPMTR